MNPHALDPREHSFSHAQGYEEIPGPLKLEQLPSEARVRLWNAIYPSLTRNKRRVSDGAIFHGYEIGGDWKQILLDKHVTFDVLPLDDWNADFESKQLEIRRFLERRPFNKVFDLIHFILRHKNCPNGLVGLIARTFKDCRLAYNIDETPPPTIFPVATPEEGTAVVNAIAVLHEAGLNGSTSHLKNASDSINGGDWVGGVRDSILAVESVARQLDPANARTLGPALASIEKHGRLHPVLKDVFKKLYGYTSDEQGIRHALLDSDAANVGIDEAVFMLGACASFASYLWRKHVSN